MLEGLVSWIRLRVRIRRVSTRRPRSALVGAEDRPEPLHGQNDRQDDEQQRYEQLQNGRRVKRTARKRHAFGAQRHDK